MKEEAVNLDPEAPGLDEATRRRRRILANLRKKTPEEKFQLAVRAGIFTPEGEWTPFYTNPEPSPYRPDRY